MNLETLVGKPDPNYRGIFVSKELLGRRAFSARAAHLAIFGIGMCATNVMMDSLPEQRTSAGIPIVPMPNQSVEHYTVQIMQTASTLYPLNLESEGSYGAKLGGFLVCAFAIAPPCKQSAKLTYALSGILTLADRAVDTLSTMLLAHATQDKRFKKYGFYKYHFQQNQLYTAHPKPSEVITAKGVLVDTATVIIGTMNLPLGFMMGEKAISTAYNNYHAYNILKYSYKIGDRVQTMINKGCSEKEIRKDLNRMTQHYIRRPSA